MSLAHMLNIGKNELICDLAETYHIYDFRGLPALLVATLSCGLRDNSRIMMKISGRKVPDDIYLLSGIADRLTMLLWKDTKDGRKGRNRPKLILDALEKDNDVVGFNSSADFERIRNEILKGD